jgi:hypothetical protein
MSEDEKFVPIFVKLCNDKAAYEVLIQRKIAFNLEKVKKLLEASGNYQILVDTPHMIILSSSRAETTFSKDGRMLIKKVRNENDAASVAREILRTALKTTVS